jgi:hypothetical protein
MIWYDFLPSSSFMARYFERSPIFERETEDKRKKEKKRTRERCQEEEAK